MQLLKGKWLEAVSTWFCWYNGFQWTFWLIVVKQNGFFQILCSHYVAANESWKIFYCILRIQPREFERSLRKKFSSLRHKSCRTSVPDIQAFLENIFGSQLCGASSPYWAAATHRAVQHILWIHLTWSDLPVFNTELFRKIYYIGGHTYTVVTLIIEDNKCKLDFVLFFLICKT